MKLAVVMDALSTLNVHKDTSLLLLNTAHSMGWETVYLTMQDLFYEGGEVYANVTPIIVKDGGAFILGDKKNILMRAFDIVLMRQDPPVNTEYLYATYLLELLERKGVVVANRPQSLRDANEKLFVLNFPLCHPPTLVSSQYRALFDFWESHHNIVLKPLDGMGGSRIFHVRSSGENLTQILEVLTEEETKTIMAQCYIPEILETGDKRILLIHGKPVPYALARIPKKGDIRGNLARGAIGKVVPLTERDYWIAEQVSPILIKKGLSLVGIDVIGDYLTEINVTSPTCMVQIMKETNINIAAQLLQGLANQVIKT